MNLAEATQIKLGVGNFLPALDVSEVWLGSTKIWPAGLPQYGQSINGSLGERLGSSLAINSAGNVVVAGAPFNSDVFSFRGAVKVFYQIWNSPTTPEPWYSDWIPTLYGSGVADFFGSSIAINSNATSDNLRVAVAALNDECKIFQNSTAINQQPWTQLGQTLTHSKLKNVRMNAFGNVVALSGNDGLARVYAYNGTNWVQRGPQLTIPSTQTDRPLAIDLNADGDRIAMASHTATSTGTCHIYRWNGSSWGQEAVLTPPDSVSNNNSFGFSVSMSHDGSTVAIGDPFAPLFGAGTNVGRVIIYTRNSNNSWNYLHMPINGENAQETFGVSTSLNFNGTTLAVSHRLGARVFTKFTFSQTETRWNKFFEKTLESNNAATAIDIAANSTFLAMSEFESLDGKIRVFPLF